MVICGFDVSINATGCVKLYLSDDFQIYKIDYLSFTQVKKNESKNILFYGKKQFSDDFEQTIWMLDKIGEFSSGADYIAFEDYAYGAKGLTFRIAEFTGLLKMFFYESRIKFRTYDIASIKMFACLNGRAEKKLMVDHFDKHSHPMIDLSHLNQYGSPKDDVVDAYYIALLLRTELMLRAGHITLKGMPDKHIQIFNRTTKANKDNLLTRDFYERKS